MNEVPSLEKQYLVQSYIRYPVTINHGEGCYFWDTEGRRYLDFITGIGVNALGYSHPRILSTLQEQSRLCVHTSNLFYHPYQGRLAKRLAEWSGLSRVFFTNSGAEAVEVALKVARAVGKKCMPHKQKIVALVNSFHGRSAGALSVTGQARYREPFEPLLEGVEFVPVNDTGALKRAFTTDTAAVITETIQGEGGIYPLTAEFVKAVRESSRDIGALWIADETQCGLGRTGTRFAYQRFIGLLPDIVVTAKPLAAGLPLGATMFSEDAAATVEVGMHGSTFGGGPLACRVALEVLDTIDELLPAIRDTGDYFFRRLNEIKRRHDIVSEVRGDGLMAGLQLSIPGDDIVQACLARGLAINCTHDTVLRLLPPLIVSSGQIDEAIAVLDAVLTGRGLNADCTEGADPESSIRALRAIRV